MNKVDVMGWSPKLFKDVHGADLDAHVYAFLGRYRIGQYITAPYTREGAGNANSANTMYACPVYVARTMTFDRIAISVSAASGASTSVRLGIYQLGTNSYPGALVLDAGTVTTDATGIRAITISKQLTKGWYWTAALFESTPSAIYSRMISPLGNTGQADGFEYSPSGWNVAQTYGALPDPFTASGTLTDWARIIALRVLTLD